MIIATHEPQNPSWHHLFPSGGRPVGQKKNPRKTGVTKPSHIYRFPARRSPRGGPVRQACARRSALSEPTRPAGEWVSSSLRLAEPRSDLPNRPIHDVQPPAFAILARPPRVVGRRAKVCFSRATGYRRGGRARCWWQASFRRCRYRSRRPDPPPARTFLPRPAPPPAHQ